MDPIDVSAVVFSMDKAKAMNEPLISIVMSTVRPNEYLDECIHSILRQSYTNWELLLIDDGSATGLPAKKYLNDPRIFTYRNDKNMGLPYSLNLGVKLSRGKLIARMDDDDTMHPDRLLMQLKAFQENDLDICSGYALVVDEHGRPYKVLPSSKSRMRLVDFVFNTPIVHPSVMFARDWIVSNKYDETLLKAQDWELWIRTYGLARIKILDNCLINYRSVSSTDPLKLISTYRAQLYILRGALKGVLPTLIHVSLYLILSAKIFYTKIIPGKLGF